ncbi:hypothetical protein Back11_11240 [Paenibacillus baekrokdamisoli]|uniref:Peptidyl-prolyl cis-trans isomerase n=1 Tax=Paenibacillus baekrokdamisoli TaxID=1712516 RepID=A0A3G9J9X7_9BACL|nr:peptidylprolyl isomerase [Paenibacillus baekrokdamisoli]MBB3067031.1 cyclophilin family peptidyl-prolyl cis-trans isomerase/uncharacterized protein YceK [Paenibacillus baekrokdamisoli]BBH19779.1 hypothetical protein Back11_11240 [Paenibacillus baekrokdamisoli]
MKRMILLLAVLVLVLSGCGAKTNNETSSTGDGASTTNNGASTTKSWTKAPEMTIDKTKSYLAHFKTTKGDFTVELYTKDAPITVNNFVFLANQKFYDGIKFHRIISDFMIQTGDPTGTGAGGPGYNIEDELKNGHTYEDGILAMANTGKPNSGGSQFFICTGPRAVTILNSNPKYSIFGKVKDGMDIVTAIANTPVAESSDGELSLPTEDVRIKSITIEEK